MWHLKRFVGLAASLTAFTFATLLVAETIGSNSTDPLDSTIPPLPSLTDSGTSYGYRPPIRVTYFPPTTPIFGATIPEANPRLQPIDRFYPAAPEEIADYVGEAFYSALGTRVFEHQLGDKAAGRLAAYRTTRDRLLGDLQNELTVAGAADPGLREQELREYSVIQTPLIAALEEEADGLREEFIRGGWWATAADWNATRGWHLGDPPRIRSMALSFAENAEFQVLRAAVFFQAGLGPAQRGLLREVALELQESRLVGRRGQARDPLTVFFSPATARFHLPAKLPPTLGANLGKFFHDRDALKRELRETVVAEDKHSASQRTKAFRALTEQQWPRFKALDELAEIIRSEFAALPRPALPGFPAQISPTLLTRIADYKSEKAALEEARLAHHRVALPEQLGLGIASTGGRPSADQIRQLLHDRAKQVQQADREIREANAARFEALRVSLGIIFDELTALAASTIDPETGRPLDVPTLMRQINATDAVYQKFGREEVIYRDYRTAMFEPGLSPEQRRLLFSAALAGLAQPLPRGSRFPGDDFTPAW